MFLKKFKPFINSVRFRKKIDSSLSNIKNIKTIKKSFFKIRIKNNHKFMTNSNCVNKTNIKNYFYHSFFIILNYFKISYSNKLYSYCLNGNNSIVIKPLCYGFSFEKIYKNTSQTLIKIFKTKKKNKKKYFLVYNNVYFFGINSKIYTLSSINIHWNYAVSAGTYCLYLNFNNATKLLLIKIPSTKRMYFDIYSSAFCGRNANIYSKNLFYTSYSQQLKLKKKIKSVRGVAMNPIDHPNGGSSKTKKPLRTPWFTIAKKHK